jgi:hypothetical protein
MWWGIFFCIVHISIDLNTAYICLFHLRRKHLEKTFEKPGPKLAFQSYWPTTSTKALQATIAAHDHEWIYSVKHDPSQIIELYGHRQVHRTRSHGWAAYRLLRGPDYMYTWKLELAASNNISHSALLSCLLPISYLHTPSDKLKFPEKMSCDHPSPIKKQP